MIARQSTARTVIVGPALDADGVAVTSLAVSAFKVSKNGGAPGALDGSATLTHRNTGHYSLALTANDLDTVGQAEIVIDSTTNACPVKVITVVEEAVYDALFASAAPGYVANAPVNVAQISGDSTAADNLEAAADGTGYNLGGGSIVAASVTGAVGSVTGAVGSVTGNVGGNVTGSVGSVATGGITAASIATGAIDADALAADAAAEIADAVWDEARSGHVAAGSFGEGVASVQGNVTGNVAGSVGSVTGAVGSVTGNVGGNVAGSVDSVVDPVTVGTNNDKTGYAIGTGGIAAAAFAAGAIDAAALAADAVDEILDEQIGDSTVTMRQALKLLAATLGGKLSGAATTTVTIRNVADDTNVVTATVDADGNRSAVTLSL